MLYIISLVLITGSLYRFIAFIHFPLPPLPTSGNQKSDLFFYLFGFFVSIKTCSTINMLVHVIQEWFGISIHFQMITTVSLIMICCYAKVLHSYCL